ncbi:hypothetical protein [Amycolatopsis sp. RTGN1]|uniref:hypothetical protein n=1 Tax=Amycolatopsis ponsaeliensis TaxID=2992142 RepID=UPI0025503702|nr:hypothetical protein [Amycolatopsis sp. RTGN1]
MSSGNGSVKRCYHLPDDISVPESMAPDDRRRLTSVVRDAITGAVRAATTDDTVVVRAAARAVPRERADRTGATYDIPSFGDEGRKVPLPVGGAGPEFEDRPTLGNLPRDEPDTVRRVELRLVRGKWREVDLRGRTSHASGNYVFVVQDERIYAVKRRWTTIEGGPAGHTEAARGHRVTWAGTVTISRNTGQVTRWDDASGHYRPAAMLRQSAIDAGLPENRWRQSPETLARPRPASEPGSQLPVFQPRTRSRTGEPARIRPGAPQPDLLEAHLRGGGSAPVAAPAGNPEVPPQGRKVVGRVSFSYDTEAHGDDRVLARNIDLSDYPGRGPGRINRFFAANPLAEGFTRIGVSESANKITDLLMDKVADHFAKVVPQARAALLEMFPTGEQMIVDYQIVALSAAADEVIDGHQPQERPLAENIADLTAYQDALNEAVDQARRYQAEIVPILDDLQRRANVLADVVNDLDRAFAWIHRYLPVLFAYYQSFLLWRAKEMFHRFHEEINVLIRLLDGRDTQYRRLVEHLDKRQDSLIDRVGDPSAWADELLARARRGGTPQRKP